MAGRKIRKVPGRRAGKRRRAGGGTARAATAKPAIDGIRWPPVAAAPATRGDRLIAYLDKTQWWPEDRLVRHQMLQLQVLIEHAGRTVPFYAERLAAARGLGPGALTLEAFRALPVLGRADVQGAGKALISRALPPSHGRMVEFRTSGSTGQPVSVMRADLSAFFGAVTMLRYHLWHRRDLGAKNLTVKALKAGIDVMHASSWLPGAATGPALVCSNALPLDDLFDLIIREDPDYLQCHPATLGALIRRSRDVGITPKSLREARTSSEVLDAGLRDMCRRDWGVPVSDNYSAEELGIMALQCPDHAHMHVQAENVLIEVVDEDGRPCPPGVIGRVVVTALHDFAMPLIRYEIGDYGELGAPCPCGRGLPVLNRIVGRERNMVRLPGGGTLFPVLGSEPVLTELPIRQYQLVQTSLTEIEMRLVMDDPLSAAQEDRLRDYFGRNFRYPFDFRFIYVDEIPRAAGGKYEVFRSEVGEG